MKYFAIAFVLFLSACAAPPQPIERATHHRLDHFQNQEQLNQMEGEKVAVLPFSSLTPDQGWRYAEEFSLFMGSLQRFNMIERMQVQKLFAEQDFDPNRIDEEAAVRIGKMLGAKAVVVGSAHDYVNARMVNTESGTHIWNVRQTLDGGAEAPASVRRAVTIGMVGTLNKAVLGINLLEVGQLTTAERNIHGVTDVIGAVVAEILPGSPSEGVLQIGDVIRNIDGRPIRDPADVILAVFGKTPGDALNINLKRRGRVMTVTVISAARMS